MTSGYRLVPIILTLLLLGACAPGKGHESASGADQAALSAASADAVKAFESGDSRRSLGLYRQLSAAEPSNAVYKNNLGVLLLKEGQPKAAMDAFESASLLDPANADYLVNIGFAKIAMDEYDDAITFFDRGLQMAPEHVWALYGKGLSCLYLGETELALGLFNRATAITPENLEVRFMRAYAAQKSELWGDAMSDYTMVIEGGGNPGRRADAFSNRALCYFQLGEYEKGMADINRAISLNDTSAVYYYNRAQGFQMQQKFEEAVQDYTRAIARQAGFPEAYINRGELYFLLKKDAKGCEDLHRACELGFCDILDKYEAKGKCKQ